MNKAKIFTIAGAAILTVVLYFTPRQGRTVTKEKAETRVSEVFNFDELLSFQKKNLENAELQKAEDFENALKQNQNNLNLYDSLAAFWDTKKMFALSASYYETKASKDNSERSHLNAAYRYFDAYKTSPDSIVRISMAEKAISNYNKVTEINPKNLDAKTDLGILYAEASAEPMKGIMMLREVVTEKPDHENAQLNLGLLSIKSSQFEKALERFDKVLQINPSRTDMYVYKGQTFLQMGNKEKAIENFEKFKSVSGNIEMNKQVDMMIREINNLITQ